ncbi:MAG: tetratricopeptide repeat protein [Thermodesulfobacteriota bacterium]
MAETATLVTTPPAPAAEPRPAAVAPPLPAPDDTFLLDDTLAPWQIQQASAGQQAALAEAEELVRGCRWPDLLALFHPVEEKVPELVAAGLDAELRLKVAFALGQSGRFPEALATLRLAVARLPDSFLGHSSLAFTACQYIRSCRTGKVALAPATRQELVAEAHRHFGRCQALRPETVTGFYRQGILFQEIERKSRLAIPLFERARANWLALSEKARQERHQERPKFRKSLYHLAVCLAEDHRLPRAQALLEELLAEDPAGETVGLLFTHFGLAKIHLAAGRPAKAREHCQVAVAAAAPDQAIDFVWELCARACLALGEADAGLVAIGRVPERARRPYVRWTEGDCLAALGRPEEAERLWRQAAERDRRSRHRPLLRLARLHLGRGRLTEALAEAEAAERFCQETYGNPSLEAMFWRAACLFRLGRLAEAAAIVAELERRHLHYPHLGRLAERIRQGLESGGDGHGPRPPG